MCFSAVASFTLAAACAGAGAYSVARCPAPKYLPLAVMPLGFGVHQAIEGLVWLQIEASPAGIATGLAPVLFMLFATILWPVFVPAAIRAAEEAPRRRQMISILLAVGALIAATFVVKLITADTMAQVEAHHVRYSQAVLSPPGPPWQWLLEISQNNLIVLPYAAVVVISLFLSRLNAVRGFGALVALNLILTLIMDRPVLISVWCFFAAVGSILIALAMAEARALERRSAAA